MFGLLIPNPKLQSNREFSEESVDLSHCRPRTSLGQIGSCQVIPEAVKSNENYCRLPSNLCRKPSFSLDPTPKWKQKQRVSLHFSSCHSTSGSSGESQAGLWAKEALSERDGFSGRVAVTDTR